MVMLLITFDVSRMKWSLSVKDWSGNDVIFKIVHNSYVTLSFPKVFIMLIIDNDLAKSKQE